MKVLLTATVQSHICQFHRPLVEVLHEHGCEVHVAARDNLAEKNGLKLDFVEKIFDVPFSRSPKSVDNVQAYKQLRGIIENGGYDIIHCNTPMGGIVTRLAARRARKNGTKVFYTAHGFHFYQGSPKMNWLVFYPIEKFFSGMSDKIITINYEDYEIAKAKFKCPVFHIHGAGVDERRFHQVTWEERMKSREKLGIDKNDFVILCVGELLPNKNQIMVIKAMEKLIERYPHIKLLLAGNGPQRNELNDYIFENGLGKNVKLLGYCTNLEEYQQTANLGVSCSIREGLGFNIIEAMLSGNPVIATQNRGHKELIINGENGYLIDVNDILALSQKIEELFLNRKLCVYLSGNGKKVAQVYSKSNVKIELAVIYGFKMVNTDE